MRRSRGRRSDRAHRWSPPTEPTIFTILIENHDYNEIVRGSGSPGATNAPYIDSLIADYALATNYKDTGHPSTPNYLHLISGANQYPGVFDVLPTDAVYFPSRSRTSARSSRPPTSSGARIRRARGSAGWNLANDGEFVPRHDPFLYFKDQQ